VLFDFFKTLNTGEPENEGDPPVFNQDTDDLNKHGTVKLKFAFRTSKFCLASLHSASNHGLCFLLVSFLLCLPGTKVPNTNPKEYWKIINSGRKQISPNISINVLFDFFKTLNTGEPENEGDPPVFNQDTDDLNNIINAPITIDEIKSAMKNLKNNKASGEDLIANEYLKHSFEIMSDIYVKLFNLIFDKGLIPEQWLYGDIIPIFKNKGDKSDPKNYRPITIVSCFGKLFTSVLNNRLNKFSDQYHVILENQGGFRKGYSTNDNLFILHILIHIMKKKKKKLYCAFIDFAKAFDTVWRNGLWNKLLINQINGKMYNVIFNMYQNIKSRIQYNKETSNYFECNAGVRQGENHLVSINYNILKNYQAVFASQLQSLQIKLYHQHIVLLTF
jgi:hypothetical protein